MKYIVSNTKESNIILHSLFVAFIYLFLFNTASASTYYVDSSIIDVKASSSIPDCIDYNPSAYSCGGGTASAYKTIADISAKAFSPGDSILFKRGDTFYGSFTVTQSGASGNPITYSSYGSGVQPVITGFKDVASWKNLGGNIWESTDAVSTLASLNIVLIGGANTPMGRTPNLNQVYFFQSHDGNNSITSSNLNGTPNWTGAEIVTRKEGWVWQVSKVTSQAGGKVSYTDIQLGIYSPRSDNSGFFFQNDIRTLDQQNEWYYDTLTKKLSIYSASQPSGVKVSSVDSLVGMYKKDYITFSDLHFTGANKWALFINTSNNTIVSDSTIDNIGYFGITTYADNLTKIDNNIFDNCNHVAVNSGGGSSDSISITNNNISNTYMIQGVGQTVYPLGALTISASNALVQYNNIDYSGYNGIIIASQTATVKNNSINHSMQKLSDGGGIYTGGNKTNVLIEGNIVLNSLGYPLGAPNNYIGAKGIYLDKGSTNVTARNNVVSGNEVGMSMSSNNVNNTFDSNTSFDNVRNIDITNFFGAYGVTNSNVVTNNKFVTKSSGNMVAKYQSSYPNDMETFFSNMDNNIYARPINDVDTIYFYQPGITAPHNFKNLSYWQSFIGKDTNSKKSPIAVSNTSDIFFDYNASRSSKNVSLPWVSVDLNGNKQSAGSITIPPYSSVIFLKDTTPLVATPVTFTFNGPTSGNMSSTSSNFTVTPSNIFSGTITITMSGTAAAGLPVITKTFASSSAAQAFTITPKAEGVITLTQTNSKGLVNPSSLTYTSSKVMPVSNGNSAIVKSESATVPSVNAPVSSNVGSSGSSVSSASSGGGSVTTTGGGGSYSSSIQTPKSSTLTEAERNAIIQMIIKLRAEIVIIQEKEKSEKATKSGITAVNVTSGSSASASTSSQSLATGTLKTYLTDAERNAIIQLIVKLRAEIEVILAKEKIGKANSGNP